MGALEQIHAPQLHDSRGPETCFRNRRRRGSRNPSSRVSSRRAGSPTPFALAATHRVREAVHVKMKPIETSASVKVKELSSVMLLLGVRECAWGSVSNHYNLAT